ncbi:hypothetical protein [Albibacillus kandeliae]|uniref:hypothetical protein n=1 Tax=Albibacillus kandeliae TaxID=2174228 RepID=UPI0013005485|nr:hypothetical protein [Albibacillus kandeliae]
MSIARNPMLLLLVILSWMATAYGVYLKTGGPTDPTQNGFVLGLLFAGPGLLFAALVQVLGVKWLDVSLLPRSVNPLKTVTTALFLFTFAISVTFGLAFYGSVFNSFGNANSATIDSARAAVIQPIDAAIEINDEIRTALTQLSSALQTEMAEEGKTGKGPRYRTLERGMHQVNFALKRSQSVDPSSLAEATEKAKDIAEIRTIALRVSTFGARDYRAIEENLIEAEKALNSIADNERQMHAALSATIEAVRRALAGDVPPAGEINDTFVSPVEWAFDVWGRLLANPGDLNREELLAVILAIVVDLFIAMLVIVDSRRGSPMANDVNVISTELSEGATRFDHIVRNVGLKDATEAIHKIEQSGNSADKLGFIGGQIVFTEVPVAQTSFHNLMLALKAVGYATELPFAPFLTRLFKREWMEFDESARLKVFWIGRSRWQQLQSFKLIALAAQALDADMVFGDFIEWLRTEPRARERMGRNVDTMARVVSRQFPNAMGMRLSDLTPEVRDKLIEDFHEENARALRASTRRTYIGYFQTILAAAGGQGMLPDRNVERGVKLRVA